MVWRFIGSDLVEGIGAALQVGMGLMRGVGMGFEGNIVGVKVGGAVLGRGLESAALSVSPMDLQAL